MRRKAVGGALAPANSSSIYEARLANVLLRTLLNEADSSQ